MKTLRVFAVIALAAMIGTSAHAEKKERPYKPAPYMFVGVQGGATKPFVNEALDRKWAPMGAVNFGAYFTPWLGARLQGSAWTFDEDFLNKAGSYNSKYYGGNIDLLLNLSGMFFPSHHNLINIVALAGGGKHYAKFDVDETSFQFPLSLEGNRWVTSSKVGGQIDVNVAKHFSILLEAGSQYIYDQVNGFKVDKWCPYALVGLNYKFAHKKNPNYTEPVAAVPVVEEPAAVAVVEEPQPEPVVETPAVVEEPKPVVVEEPKPVVVEEPKPEPVVVKAKEKDTKNVFFRIGRYTIGQEQQSVVNAIAQWAEAHPTAEIVLTGYADRETGNADVNQRISERRAASVKDALVKAGVRASRITTYAKGDTIQPFAENDKNRAVVAVSEEK